MFFKIVVIQNSAIFVEKQLCWLMQAFFYRTPKVAASVFLRQQILFFQLNLLFKIQSLELFYKKGVLRNFAIFTGKHVCCSLFKIGLQAFRPVALLKRDSNTDAFLWNLQNIYQHLLNIYRPSDCF